ncbi:MAG: 6-phosphogluconolactonase [Chloroflexi bacterium]|nr:6-phosphogluconolactonase [Chloroflexota bacterium]
MTEQGGALGEPEILVLPDADAVSATAGRRIAEALAGAVTARGVAHWATTGGSTPSPIYEVLAAQPLRDAVPWPGVHVWWTDDRWAPPDGPLSNARAFLELLQPRVPIPAANVHPVPVGEAMAGGQEASWAASRYAESLRGVAIPVDAAGYPVLDVVLVGIGGDGHLFSVFPGSATWDNAAWVQAVPAPTHIEPQVARVTLHPRILDACRHPIVVVHGASKAAILARIFGPRSDPRELPALAARRRGATWILDEGAALLLPAHIGRSGSA